MMSVSVPVFSNQYLEVPLGGAMITSAPFALQGNKAVLSLTVLNSSGTLTGTVAVQGSYDGLAWVDLTKVISTSPAIPAFGNVTDAGNAGLDYAFLRVRAILTVNTSKMLFDATVVMSTQ